MMQLFSLQNALKLWSRKLQIPQKIQNDIFSCGIKNLLDLTKGLQRCENMFISQPHNYNGKVVKQLGNSRLYFYGSQKMNLKDKIPLLLVPSHINRGYILDLTENRSFCLNIRSFSKDKIVPYLIEWGSPKEEELDFTLEDYIYNRLLPYIEKITNLHQQPLTLAGYCMGGVLSVASTQLFPSYINKLITISTPWNFHSEDSLYPKLTPTSMDLLHEITNSLSYVPANLLQFLMYLQNQLDVNEKFINISKLSNLPDIYKDVEIWVNDGMNMSIKVFLECVDWIQANSLYNKTWKINGTTIDPLKLHTPNLVALSTKDKIVPKDCALGLVEQLKSKRIIMRECGHIGMIIKLQYSIIGEIINFMENGVL